MMAATVANGRSGRRQRRRWFPDWRPWLQLRFMDARTIFSHLSWALPLASLLCGMATSLSALILFRIVQGAFGGGLLSDRASRYARYVSQRSVRDSRQSIFAVATILGPSIGPTLGGILIDNFSWPWVFDVNLVPGIVAVVLLWRYMRDNAKPQRASVDVTGIALLIVAVSCMQYVLDQGQHDDWFSNQLIQLCTFLAVTATAAFVWWELRVAQPIVDLRICARLPSVRRWRLPADSLPSYSRHCCSCRSLRLKILASRARWRVS